MVAGTPVDLVSCAVAPPDPGASPCRHSERGYCSPAGDNVTSAGARGRSSAPVALVPLVPADGAAACVFTPVDPSPKAIVVACNTPAAGRVQGCPCPVLWSVSVVATARRPRRTAQALVSSAFPPFALGPLGQPIVVSPSVSSASPGSAAGASSWSGNPACTGSCGGPHSAPGGNCCRPGGRHCCRPVGDDPLGSSCTCSGPAYTTAALPRAWSGSLLARSGRRGEVGGWHPDPPGIVPT